MARRRDDRIVVDVVDPIRRPHVLLYEDIHADHAVCTSVVAQRLHLQQIIAEQRFTVAALVLLVGVDVEASTSDEVAHPEEVATHRWVMTQIERRDVPAAERLAYELPSAATVEEDALEPLADQRGPASKTIAQVSRYVSIVVQELKDYLGNQSNQLAFAVLQPL